MIVKIVRIIRVVMIIRIIRIVMIVMIVRLVLIDKGEELEGEYEGPRYHDWSSSAKSVTTLMRRCPDSTLGSRGMMRR